MYYTIQKNIKHLNWDCIATGIEKDLLLPDTAIAYANYFVENYPQKSSAAIIELLISETYDKATVLSLISSLTSDGDKNRENDLRVLRYVILSEIWQEEKDEHKLLQKVEGVYADFDYPSDMDSFISYMPPCDDYNASEHTAKENNTRLINKFEAFMQKEWMEVIS